MPRTIDPESFGRLAQKLVAESHGVAGCLTDREVRFLAMLGACVQGPGVLLEIGSFKGRSTIVLAKAAAAAHGVIDMVAVDPLTSPSETDPSLDGKASGRDEFFANLEAAGVTDDIEFHETFSENVAASWDRPIRLLWIDGDHTEAGVRADVNHFAHRVIPGA